MMPAIQVGISVYKQRAIHVQNCVESCLLQNNVDIAVDLRLDGPDACDDSLKAWLMSKAEKYDNFHVHEGSKNIGTFASYKWIFSRRQTPYLCQVDADDLLAIDSLHQSLLSLDRHRNFGFLYSNCLDIDENGCPLSLNHRQKMPYSKQALLTTFMTFHMRLIRRLFYDRVGGYDPSLKCVGDYDLCLKLSEVAPVYFLDRPLYFYRLSSTSYSKIASQLLEEEVLLICKNALIRRNLDSQYIIKSGPHKGQVELSRVEDGTIPTEGGRDSEIFMDENNIFYIMPEETSQMLT